MQKTLAVDFDGVLYDWDGNWLDGALLREPIDGAVEFCNQVIAQGIEVVVHTCRALTEEGTQAVREWLKRKEFPDMTVTARKPHAMWYLDDRGVRFTGNFHAVLCDLAQLERPWWKANSE